MLVLPFPWDDLKAVQCAPEDAFPSRPLVMARMQHFPEAYSSTHKSEAAGGGTPLIKPCCTLTASSLASMFAASMCLERFSRFPALCMGRVGFAAAWLGSKQQRALALLLLGRREEPFCGSRAMWAAASGHGRAAAGTGRGGSRPLPSTGGAAAARRPGLAVLWLEPPGTSAQNQPANMVRRVILPVLLSESNRTGFAATNLTWSKTLLEVRGWLIRVLCDEITAAVR